MRNPSCEGIVSRSTIARQMAELYASGAYESIYVKVSPRVTICYYRLKDWTVPCLVDIFAIREYNMRYD